MLKFVQHGDFSKTTNFLKKAKDIRFTTLLEKYANLGEIALSHATPQDTRLTSTSWGHEFKISRNGFKIYWTNTNIVNGIPVVILLQYGHGTTGGTFVEGRDFINPAMRPIFEQISEDLWKEVTRL